MPRLSITLTESQAQALDRIAAATCASRQSMIGLAVSAWIRENEYLAESVTKTRESAPEPFCEVCGAPMDGFTVGPDGLHPHCDEHAHLFAE